MERLDTRPLPTFRDAILVLACMRDEARLLPSFLAHHRAVGADHFFLIDNGSRDGTPDIALAAPDVTLYRTRDSYPDADSGRRWLNHLLDLHGAENWCIIVDADEELMVADPSGLRPVLDGMAARGEEAMAGFMLDTFAPTLGSLAEFRPGDRPLNHTPFIDPAHFFCAQADAPYRQVRGGIRRRLFGTIELLEKVVVLRGGRGIRFTSSHRTTPARMAAATGVVLHHILLRDGLALARAPNPLEASNLRDRRAREQSRYRRYADVLSGRADDEPLEVPGALRVTGPDVLLRAGLLSDGREPFPF